ncbi:hypothetical protein [Sphingosinithalassobacter sp. CS137]|uniref:hypothetical protein n=1 Tax=Sphingosinithalassobacter sp. CS137 TaxID=2762748 RepID=UPI00165D65BF|nr:hypothetical protein [Sphingosinithalassobacter sp. CS137]
MRDRGMNRKMLARGAIVLVLGGALLWLVSVVTVAQVRARTDPAGALAVWGWNSEALGGGAIASIQADPEGVDTTRVRALAVRALQRDPTSVTAAATLGILAAMADDDARAVGAFTYAQSLSRRDPTTNLWMIEHAVQAGDVRSALANYDRAMLTSRSLRPLLTTTLAQATSDPAVFAELAPMVRRRPLWWADYVSAFITSSPTPARTFPRMFALLALNPQVPREREWLKAAMHRLIDEKAYATAAAFYRATVPGSVGLLRNGSFEAANDFPPFDWQFTDTPELLARQEAASGAGGGAALLVEVQRDRGGLAAQQLLTLAPGQYRLTGHVGAPDAIAVANARLALRCYRSPGELASITLPTPRDAGANFGLSFRVGPNDCAVQTLDLLVSESGSPRDAALWLDDLHLEPLSNSVGASARPPS